jgi:hypothetical protein
LGPEGIAVGAGIDKDAATLGVFDRLWSRFGLDGFVLAWRRSLILGVRRNGRR